MSVTLGAGEEGEGERKEGVERKKGLVISLEDITKDPRASHATF